MVVEDYYNGSCHIKVNDQYCKDVTKEQINEISEKIDRIYRLSEMKRIHKN